MRDDLVTIATFNNQANAHLLKGRLESEGIEAVVFNPQPASGLVGIAAVGGILVQVWPEHEEKARLIVEQLQQVDD